MLKKPCRVLIPSYEPGTLDSKIYPHWKDAEVFVQVEFDDNRIYEVKKHKLSSDDLIINIVKRENIAYVITYSLSIRALELLQKAGVKVLSPLEAVSTVGEAIDKFRKCDLAVVKLNKTPMSTIEELCSP